MHKQIKTLPILQQKQHFNFICILDTYFSFYFKIKQANILELEKQIPLSKAENLSIIFVEPQIDQVDEESKDFESLNTAEIEEFVLKYF